MGGVGGLVGLGGGAAGTNFDAPQQASIQTGVDTAQTGHAYDQNQQALYQQQALMQALQAQNGLQNQSDVYGQLQNVASGQGPNPAQAMLNQQTGANVSNQAALMAGQRGASSNAGLIARQAGMQGGNLQQQAVGQGATMQANQSLNALNAAGNIANTQVTNQMAGVNANTQANQAEQSNLLNALGANNTARVGSQSSVNAGNTALANTQIQGQKDLIGGAMQGMGSMGSSMMGGMGGARGGVAGKDFGLPRYDEGGMLPMDALPPSTGPSSVPLASAANPTTGSGASGIPLAAAANPTSGVGPVASGAQYANSMQAPSIQQGPQSSFGQFLSGVSGGGQAQQAPSEVTPADASDAALAAGASSMFGGGGGGKSGGGGGGGGFMQMLASNPELLAAASDGGSVGSGDMVDVVVSPGEKIVSPNKVAKAAGGKVEAKTVPGKAAVKGDSLKNDTVKTKLPPGTIVVPRTKSKDKKSTASFVQATLAKRGRK